MPKKKQQKSIYDQVRKPLPPPGRAQTTKKGKKGYDRKRVRRTTRQELESGSHKSQTPLIKSEVFCYPANEHFWAHVSFADFCVFGYH